MRLFLLLALLPFSAVSAQTQNILWHPDKTLTGTGNAFPWGSKGIRYQTIIPAAKLGNRPHIIQDVFVSGDKTRGKLEIIYDDIEIRMGNTAQATPTRNWATNNPNPKTVYRGPLRVRFDASRWQGIGLPATFVYIPLPTAKNLCFEIICWKIANQTTRPNFYFPYSDRNTRRAFLYQWTSKQSQQPATGTGASKMGLLLNDGNFVVVGTGCKSSGNTTLEIGANTWPQGNKPIDVTLTGGKGSAPAVLMMGWSFTKFGALNLPFNLALLGAKDCFLWNDPTFLGPTATTPTGTAKVTIFIPAGFAGVRLYTHYWVWDPTANGYGWTTSSQGKLLLGN